MILNPSIHKIHIIGISGTGMSALAHLLYKKKYKISGSDKAYYPPMGDFLKSLPITLFDDYSPQNIHDTKPDIIIVGNAISRGNPELEEALMLRIPLFSMPEVLKYFFLHQSRNIVVTGTHGKTTTTSLLAHLLQAPGYQASFMVGGIPLNFGIPSDLRNPHLFVLEGDEYDSAYFDKSPKFMKYNPYFLIINNIEFDHADIYSNLDEIKKQFYYVSRLVPSNGLIIANGDDPNVKSILKQIHASVVTFGTNPQNDYQFSIISSTDSYFTQIHTPENDNVMIEMLYPMIGMGYNITASFIVCKYLGLKNESILSGMSTFKGVSRRLQTIFKNSQYMVLDDFAHHPTAVKITLEAVKKKFPDQKIIAVFEPRSNTSIRNIFTTEYAEALSIADLIFLAPPYKKKSQQDIHYLDTHSIKDYLTKKGKSCYITQSHKELMESFASNIPEKGIVVLMSNGSFEPFKSNVLRFFNEN